MTMKSQAPVASRSALSMESRFIGLSVISLQSAT
jgi:hypothetical protein